VEVKPDGQEDVQEKDTQEKDTQEEDTQVVLESRKSQRPGRVDRAVLHGWAFWQG
jgi:hypothetical protein